MSDKSFIYGLIGGVMANYLTKRERPPQPQIQIPQIFDYIVDLYTDRIEVTDTNGSKTTLNSLDDLNNRLINISDKNILIRNHGDITGTLRLTSNRYVIIGEPAKFAVILTRPNIDLYHLAPNLTDEGITNRYDYLGEMTIINIYPIDNSNIFATDTDIHIECLPEGTMQNINITAIGSRNLYVCGINGGLSAVTTYANLSRLELTNGLILVAKKADLIDIGISKKAYLYIDRAYALSLYKINPDEFIDGPIDIKTVLYLGILRPGESRTAQLPSLPINYMLIVTGVYKSILGWTYSPLTESEADVVVDEFNRTISVTNKTVNLAMSIIIECRLLYPG
jgi:hypothetical protein